MNFFSRRTALAAISALALAACGNGDSAGNGPVIADTGELGHVKGAADAPVTLIEYASPTCPACKYWHDEIQPEIVRDYVDTGKVKFVFREFPLHQPDVPAYLVAMCAGEDKYFDVMAELFEYNFSEFLSRYRVEKSIPLLLEGKTTLDTCLDVGFGTATYFSTSFKKVMKLPPKKYIEQYNKTAAEQC